jgi:hypothetical protein
MKWRPIDTAPKDGQHVIVAVTGDDPPGYGYVAEAYFDEDADRWYSANTHSTDYHDGSLYPSHWMPLPTPPIHGEKRWPASTIG